MIDLFEIVELNLGDIILILFIQLGINILSFALGHQRGYQKAHDDLWKNEALRHTRESKFLEEESE